MRNLIDKNSEIKDKIHDSSSIEVFDALTTLSQEDIDFIKEELETSPTPKETFYKYLNFYQYVFFEYMFLSYEENYGKNQVYKIYDNFLPKSLIKLASVKRDIFDVMKKIIEAEYHFSKEQEKDLSTLLKFSGLSKAYKKNVFEEIAKIVSSDSKYQDPENSKEINERLITKSFKNSPRQKIKEYLLFNGEQIVEDFFESDYEISEKINKEEIKKETNLESFNIRYYFKNGRFEISIYNPENLEFKVHKKNNDFEVYDDMEVNYKVDFDEDVYFEFNNSILKDFFSFEGCSGGIQLMLVNKKTEKCIYYKLLTGDSFIEKDGIRESVLSDVVSSDYILIFYGNNKFQSIQEEQEELKNINHSLPSRFRCYDFNFDNNKVLDLDEIYKIKIEKSSRSEKRVVFDERTQSFSFLNKKKMFYGDLYFHLESSEKVSKEHLSAEVNGNIADILEDGCFYIKGDDIVAKTGLTIIKIKVYFKNKIFKTYYALYGKNYTSSGLFFEDLIDESNLEIIDGFVDKNEIKIDSNKKYLTILISKGNITKKVQVQNNLPIIKVMYKNNKEKSFGINNYIFDPAAEEYEIWFPKKRGALVYNVDSNGNPESIKELSPNKKNYITKYNNQSNSKSLKNIFFRHEDFPLIKLFEKDNKVFYDSAKNEYSLYSILGDKLYKLTEIYSRNGATKIKNNFIFPEKGMFYTLKEKHNNKQNDFYLSFLSIKNTINAEPVKYTINNVKLKENCSFIPPKRFDELLSLLHQKNWCKKELFQENRNYTCKNIFKI